MPSDILALILARGGSKGIPRKNVISIGGKPLIAHTIAQAQTSRFITRVLVSTDNDEIAAVSRQYGAHVPFMRPAEISLDLSPDLDAFRHALQWLQDHEDYCPQMVVHLRATGPVRRVELIDEAISLMLANPAADCLRSVSLAEQTPYKMWRIDNDRMNAIATVAGVRESWSQPRQKLPSVYWQNGYVDIVRPKTVLEMGMMCGGEILPFIVEEPKLELDYPEDIPVVEAALERLQKGESIAHERKADRHSV